jgi:plasmid stabilization system protein ParE
VTHQIVVRKQAESDIANAACWYEEKSPGLGTEYLRAVDACIASIARNPDQYGKVYRSIRRALLRRFPYGIFYITTRKYVIVIACLHGKLSPGNFNSRI